MTRRASRLEIRPATPADHAFIKAGVDATYDAHAAANPGYFTTRRRPRFEQNVEHGLRDGTFNRYDLALRDAAPVGYISLMGSGPVRVVQDIFVSPEERRSGIADALLDHAADLGRRGRAEVLHATVWDGNDPSHALFIAKGYSRKPGLLPTSIASLFPALRSTDYIKKLT